MLAIAPSCRCHLLVEPCIWPPALQGIPTLVLTNATGQLLQREQEEGLRFNEVWQHYPDVPAFRLTGKPGDPRAAATPALAQAALGSGFSWLLYGDVSGGARCDARLAGHRWQRTSAGGERWSRSRLCCGLLPCRAALSECLASTLAHCSQALLRSDGYACFMSSTLQLRAALPSFVSAMGPTLQDDVAFFWPGLLRALHGLHTDNPYFLTGWQRVSSARCGAWHTRLPFVSA